MAVRGAVTLNPFAALRVNSAKGTSPESCPFATAFSAFSALPAYRLTAIPPYRRTAIPPYRQCNPRLLAVQVIVWLAVAVVLPLPTVSTTL
jgi:hypothetical protein